MGFTEVAENILKDTISSALFIDDKALENFKSKSYGKFKSDHERTLDLFEDFKSNQCLLHSFKYTKSGWKKDKRFYLKNKDLLILDWQLVGEEHQDALIILDEAVSEKSLHFITIYTDESKDAVRNELVRFYWGNPENQLSKIRELLIDTELHDYWILDDSNQDKLELIESINSIVNTKENDRFKEIEHFQAKYELDQKVINDLIALSPDKTDVVFTKIKESLLKARDPYSKNVGEGSFIRSMDDEDTFYVNHTIVKVLTKDKISGDQLYDAFLKSFMKEKNIFLSLMGLEMRNRFRENSAFIGKDFDHLSEDAFFFHKNQNIKYPFVFIEFLREILKDQVSTFLYEGDLALFDVLDEYYKNVINGSKRQSDFTHSDNKEVFKKEVFDLNYFYNRISNENRKTKDFLRFGDVFQFMENGKERFLLCITAHCDCLRPDKIRNQFWFVEGKIVEHQDSVLRKTDGKFISFIKRHSETLAIEWVCQPFGVAVPNSTFHEKLKVNYFGQEVTITLIASIKENYAQRIANESFGYPVRVGIDFVKKSS